MQEKQPESTPILQSFTLSFTLSYTLSYTRNGLYLLEVLAMGVGNVGDFQKLFFEIVIQEIDAMNYCDADCPRHPKDTPVP